MAATTLGLSVRRMASDLLKHIDTLDDPDPIGCQLIQRAQRLAELAISMLPENQDPRDHSSLTVWKNIGIDFSQTETEARQTLKAAFDELQALELHKRLSQI